MNVNLKNEWSALHRETRSLDRSRVLGTYSTLLCASSLIEAEATIRGMDAPTYIACFLVLASISNQYIRMEGCAWLLDLWVPS